LETLVSLVKESHLRTGQLEKHFVELERKLIAPAKVASDVPASKAHGGPCALALAREESKALRLKVDQMDSQT